MLKKNPSEPRFPKETAKKKHSSHDMSGIEEIRDQLARQHEELYQEHSLGED